MTTSFYLRRSLTTWDHLPWAFSGKKKKLLLYYILQMQMESDVLGEVLNKEINNQL